jgi:hypothetical protein
VWSDGSALYSLNGVRVPIWIIETPKEQFTKEMITKEPNADIRREIIRKIGKTRIIELLDYKIIDKMGSYELISFDIGDGRQRPWLKMIGPSTGFTHIEGVPTEINTVKNAICFRNSLSKYEKPISLT